MGREFELKYRATPEIITVIREKYENFLEISMETAYYDTPDGALGDLHWTLRRRYENGRSVCTVKIPLPDGSRESGRRNATPSKPLFRNYVNLARPTIWKFSRNTALCVPAPQNSPVSQPLWT